VAGGDRGAQSLRPAGVLVLAAVARAQRHRTAPGTGVTRREIEAHLALQPRSAAARAASAELERLATQGTLRWGRRHGVNVWSVTARGHALLAGAGSTAQLPEAPQHRAWRRARARAGLRIERLRRQLQTDLRDAERLLGRSEPAVADAWFELARRLARDAWRLGSATYCLHEWAEPEDDRADVDDGSDAADAQLPPEERARRRLLRAGRRNIALWEA